MSIVAHSVSKYFGRTAALRSISLEAKSGEIVQLTGGNGAGKTTLLRVLAGRLPPDGGKVVSHGRLSAVVEDLGLYPALTLRENLELFRAALGEPEKSDDLVVRLGLETALDKELRHCSSGIARRASLARALLGNPKVILLDEPLANLDLEAKTSIQELLRDRARAGATIIVSTHEPALADRVIRLTGGRLEGPA